MRCKHVSRRCSMDCEACGRALLGGTHRGRPRLVCNDACWQRAYRRRKALALRGIPESPLCHLGAFQSFRNAYANKIDVIITDPPYSREYLPLYQDLITFA